MTHEGQWGHGGMVWKVWEFSYVLWVGKHLYSCLFIYIVHSSPFLCVCGDDQITCYPRADDVTGGPLTLISVLWNYGLLVL